MSVTDLFAFSGEVVILFLFLFFYATLGKYVRRVKLVLMEALSLNPSWWKFWQFKLVFLFWCFTFTT